MPGQSISWVLKTAGIHTVTRGDTGQEEQIWWVGAGPSEQLCLRWLTTSSPRGRQAGSWSGSGWLSGSLAEPCAAGDQTKWGFQPPPYVAALHGESTLRVSFQKGWVKPVMGDLSPRTVWPNPA